MGARNPSSLTVKGIWRDQVSCLLCVEYPAPLRAEFVFDDLVLAVPVQELGPETGIARAAWVVEFPLLSAKSQEVRLFDVTLPDNPIYTESFSPTGLAWRSRLNYRLHAALAEQVKRSVQGRRSQATLSVEGIYPLDEDRMAIRMRVKAPMTPDAKATALVHAAAGADMLLPTIVASRQEDAIVTQTVSIAVPYRAPWFVAWLDVDYACGAEPLFCCLHEYDWNTALSTFGKHVLDAKGDARYAEWLEVHRATEDELAFQREHPLLDGPLFSIILPVFDPPLEYLKECLASVLAQTYENWQLVAVNASPDRPEVQRALEELGDDRVKIIALSENRGIAGNTNVGIEQASGDYLAFLDQDDFLEPNCLYEYAQAIEKNPHAGLLFCDEDSFDQRQQEFTTPLFKSDWNIDLMYGHDDAVHMLVVNRYIAEQAYPFSSEVEGAQDYELAFRASELFSTIVHVPRVLYHWRKHDSSSNEGNIAAKPYAFDAGKRAIERHLERVGIPAKVEKHTSIFVYRTTFLPSNPNPLVSVVVVHQQSGFDAALCAQSVVDYAGYEALQVVIADCCGELTGTASDERGHVPCSVVDCSRAASLPAAINHAVRQTKGAGVLVCDEHIQPVSPDFVNVLAGYLSRSDAGVVAPLISDPDGLVRSAGVVLLEGGVLASLNRFLTPATHGGYLGSLECASDCEAVAGFCHFFPRAVFDAQDGYDEAFAAGLFDIDWCWRVREAGRLVVYCPYAQAVYTGDACGAIPIDDYRTDSPGMTLLRCKHSLRFDMRDARINPQCRADSPYFQLDMLGFS